MRMDVLTRYHTWRTELDVVDEKFHCFAQTFIIDTYSFFFASSTVLESL